MDHQGTPSPGYVTLAILDDYELLELPSSVSIQIENRFSSREELLCMFSHSNVQDLDTSTSEKMCKSGITYSNL